jgi:hypothetical protein
MLHDHNAGASSADPRPDAERVFDLVQGVSDLLAARSRADAVAEGSDFSELLTAMLERMGPAFARLLWLGEATEIENVAQTLGPEPAKNRRRWRQTGGPATPGDRGKPDAVSDSARLGDLLDFIAEFTAFAADDLEDRAPGSPLARAQRRTADEIAAAVTHKDRLICGFEELEASGQGFWLALVAVVGAISFGLFTEGLMTHPSLDAELDPWTRTAARMQAVAERTFSKFFLDLAELEPREALDRFLEATFEGWFR